MAAPEAIDYKKFLSMYAKTHTITYSQAMKDCSGPEGVWAKYKVENKIVPKPRVRKIAKKVVSEDAEVVAPIAKKAKPKAKPKAKAPPRKVVKVQAPPKGKRMVVTYESDDDDLEDRVEVVDPAPQSEEEEDEDEEE
jgi:hypothetical protein